MYKASSRLDAGCLCTASESSVIRAKAMQPSLIERKAVTEERERAPEEAGGSRNTVGSRAAPRRPDARGCVHMVHGRGFERGNCSIGGSRCACACRREKEAGRPCSTPSIGKPSARFASAADRSCFLALPARMCCQRFGACS